jgi:hypothetical protein
MKVSRQKTVIVALVAACASTVLGPIALEEYYYRVSPRAAQPESGRIFVESIKSFHGVAEVYLSPKERIPFQYFPLLTPVFGFAAYLLNRRWGAFSPFKKN